MTDAVLNRLAQRLLKCPFDPELFDSKLELETHLFECHGDRICEKRRVLRQDAAVDVERPVKLTICRYCAEAGHYFAIPHYGDQAPADDIVVHITQNHRPASGHPPIISFRATEAADEIERFMKWQRWKDEFACCFGNCPRRYDDTAAVAQHWIHEHVEHAKPEDVQLVLLANPDEFCERFSSIIEEAKFGVEAEAARAARLEYQPHDGCRIRHMPPVPRVRSRPSEAIIYVTSARLPKDEIRALLEMEGLDGDAFSGGDWTPGRAQVATVDLRFCNLQDGYIPLVKSVREILHRDADGQTVEMAWQDDRRSCNVSKWEWAILAPDQWLKNIFAQIPPGARLYIARIGQTHYQLSLKPNRHRVQNCKIFENDGAGGWNIIICEKETAWESNDDIFRHQITFTQMDALYAEAELTNLSVRDAVHDFMRQVAQHDPWHVRDVYEFVFRDLRTCSLAAVWAQFRPEHECYVRHGVGRYMFNPNGAFPMVRYATAAPRLLDEPHFPNRTAIEEPLLRAIIGFGGSVQFSTLGRELEIVLAREFGIPDVDRDYSHPRYHSQGNRKWRNEIQFVRAKLVTSEQLDGNIEDVWTVTDAGYRRVGLRRSR